MTDEAEPEATRQAAEERGVSEDDVLDASLAVLEWQFGGENVIYRE